MILDINSNKYLKYFSQNLYKLENSEFKLIIHKDFVKNDDEEKDKNSPLKIGELYYLHLNINSKNPVKRLVKIRHIISDLDAVVIKEENENENSSIFTLSPFDCDFLNIEYEDKLQLFSQKLHWEPVNGQNQIKKELDLNDLSTYPILKDDTKLRFCLIQIPHLRQPNNYTNNVLCYKGIVIDNIHFMVKYKDNCYFAKSRLIQSTLESSIYEISFFSRGIGIDGLELAELENKTIYDVLDVYLRPSNRTSIFY